MHMGCLCALAIVVNAHGPTHVDLPLAVWNYHFTIEFVFVVICMMFSTLLFDFVFVVIFVLTAVLIYQFYIYCHICCCI